MSEKLIVNWKEYNNTVEKLASANPEKIKVEKVLSSEWCRCKDTAKFAFKNFEVFSSLNSFYDAKFADKKEEQIKKLKKYIKEWKGEDNLVLITHYVVISEALDYAPNSGEIVISNKNFKI